MLFLKSLLGRTALFRVIFFLTSTTAFQLRGVIILNEPFDYANGPLVTVSGGVWSNHSGTIGQVEVLSGRADLSAPDSEDVNRLLAGQPYAATTNTVIYLSFTANFSTLPSPSGEYFAHLKDSTVGSGFRAKIHALTGGAGAGQFRLGIANASNGPAAVFPSDLNLNTDYRVFVRYAISNVVSTLWINPSAEGSPSVTATDTNSAKAVVALALRQNTGMGVLAMDDLRIGTSFADVYVPPPQLAPVITQPPADISAGVGGSAVFTVSATGDAPLSYQWKFNSTNLPSATNATLVLNNLALSQAGPYSVSVTNGVGATNSAPATLAVFPASSLLTFVTYNVKGNFASDWTTNAPQVQAIARELQYLNPDIITLNEIPNGLKYEMTNWMSAFFPAYHLAVSPGTDGVLRSGVISRYSITRSNSYFENLSLTNFGFNGTFTRDLFEAEIPVPGYPQPLHVFTTHLKSGTSVAGDNQRRAAEANCISNFFANGWLTTNFLRPYLLAGDLNEDIFRLPNTTQLAIQRLTNGTGLILTTPLNSMTHTDYTHSIQGSLDNRFDYIMPNRLMYSNIVSSQVFRTDLLNPVPLTLNSNDDMVASDHLPVAMVFGNPYDKPFRVLDFTRSNATVRMTWQSVLGQPYRVMASSNLSAWSTLAGNLVATSNSYTFTTNVTAGQSFFRVYRGQ